MSKKDKPNFTKEIQDIARRMKALGVMSVSMNPQNLEAQIEATRYDEKQGKRIFFVDYEVESE